MNALSTSNIFLAVGMFSIVDTDSVMETVR